LNTVLDFLLEQFDVGKQYHTINTIRSAISMTHEHFDGVAVGQHPLVTRFFQGMFNSRPPAPRYSSTCVLSYLKSPLPLTLLSYKLAVLFALANADRSSDLAALDLRFLTYQENGDTFIIPGLTKTQRSGPPKEAFYASFPEEVAICPVKTLKECELRTVCFQLFPHLYSWQ